MYTYGRGRWVLKFSHFNKVDNCCHSTKKRFVQLKQFYTLIEVIDHFFKIELSTMAISSYVYIVFWIVCSCTMVKL